MSWKVVATSVVGHSHTRDNIPCQDSYAFELIDEKSGIAIVADGAGSCENSHIGSKFVVTKGIELFKKLILENKWNETIPSFDGWRKESIEVSKNVSNALEEFASQNDYDYKSLSSTFIVTFFSKDGICSLNIGDGRGAFSNGSAKWKAMVIPYHGEQVGSTVFLTSKIWDNSDTYICTSVVEELLESFIMMSDGLEKISFECYQKSKDGKYYDPNKPFDEFLNFIVNMSKNFLKTGSDKELKEKWESFLKGGHPQLEEEQDDKTMIFGFYVNDTEDEV